MNNCCKSLTYSEYIDFNNTLQDETRLKTTFKSIIRSNIGWFSDKTILESFKDNAWGVNSNCFGVYFLWHKEDYCSTCELFHMKALYVGKGKIYSRIMDHFKNKDFSEELIVYFSYMEINNRLAKYLEQLVLDIYNLPYNFSENTGQKELYSYWTQAEVD